jgi:hypothetical protein
MFHRRLRRYRANLDSLFVRPLVPVFLGDRSAAWRLGTVTDGSDSRGEYDLLDPLGLGCGLEDTSCACDCWI